jgi:hypothetical protein
MHNRIEAGRHDVRSRPTACSAPRYGVESPPAAETNGLEEPPFLQFRGVTRRRY